MKYIFKFYSVTVTYNFIIRTVRISVCLGQTKTIIDVHGGVHNGAAVMASSITIDKADTQSYRGCCCNKQASTCSTWLTRPSVLATLVVCLLAVTLLFIRSVLLRPSYVAKISELLRSADKGTADFSVFCRPEAVAQLGQNKHSDKDRPVRRLPHCLVIGAMKGGTGALKQFLDLHPDARFAANEINFFNCRYKHGLEWYRRQMPTSHTG